VNLKNMISIIFSL